MHRSFSPWMVPLTLVLRSQSIASQVKSLPLRHSIMRARHPTFIIKLVVLASYNGLPRKLSLAIVYVAIVDEMTTALFSTLLKQKCSTSHDILIRELC